VLTIAALLVGLFSGVTLALVWRVGVIAVSLGVAASLVLRTFTGRDQALARDLKEGQVRAVTGPIVQEEEPAMDVNGTRIHVLNVGGQRFTVAERTSNAAPRSGQVRLYYLPASRAVVNLEAFDDGVPTGVPLPLADAILGGWHNAFAKAAFTADGRVTASVMGRHSTGRWSVDTAGQLHAEIGGRNEIAQASVEGAELRITLSGREVTLSRDG
jgi:hypothetical protein